MTQGGLDAPNVAKNLLGYDDTEAQNRLMLLAMGRDAASGQLIYDTARDRVVADLDLFHLAPGYADEELLMADVARSLGGEPHGDLVPTHFRDKRITLITGAQNRLWHRESIDLMYEWLRNIDDLAPSARFVKKIFPTFAHQDLYWRREGGDADVYAAIAAGLE